tara:strand:- start:193 stop:528 length:336 start_codon:yes stop_codon:yes gene_type:complete
MTLPFEEFTATAANDNEKPLNKWEAAWREFHANNPEVYEHFKRLAFKVMQRGFKHYAAYSIMQRIRWEIEIETTGDTFKINNNHTPYYARLFHSDYPEHDGFFHTRTVMGE